MESVTPEAVIEKARTKWPEAASIRLHERGPDVFSTGQVALVLMAPTRELIRQEIYASTLDELYLRLDEK